MRGRDLYVTILGILDRWEVAGVDLGANSEVVSVHMEATVESALMCRERV